MPDNPLMPSLWPKLDRRELVGELMDDPSLAEDEHLRALRGLRRINSVSRTAATLFRELKLLLGDDIGRPRTVLDVACGDGDNTLRIARLARRAGLPWRVMGCDVSPRSVEFARGLASERGEQASFFVADALSDLDAAAYDAVISTLFLHHLDDTQIAGLFNRLREAQHIVISDLVRGRLAYIMTHVGVRLLSRSGVVHVDGPLSVRAALTRGEMARHAELAGLEGAKVKRSFPMRQLLLWSRP